MKFPKNGFWDASKIVSNILYIALIKEKPFILKKTQMFYQNMLEYSK